MTFSMNRRLIPCLLFIISATSVSAGIFDLFRRDSCRQYSDYTCNQLENSPYNVYFYWPNNHEEYLGQSSSLSQCGDMAVNFSYSKEVQNENWGYICCLITKTSSCAEKHR